MLASAGIRGELGVQQSCELEPREASGRRPGMAGSAERGTDATTPTQFGMDMDNEQPWYSKRMYTLIPPRGRKTHF